MSVLVLEPEPRSVRRARVWVIEALSAIGRSDLGDAAELGVSELVTNAILHADPPITVRVGGTVAHPRVEVHDTSPAPPRIRDMNDDDRLLATVGRGLGIVATYSTSWGAEVTPRGKVVWFEPAGEDVGEGPAPVGEVFDLGGYVEQRLAGAGEPAERLAVHLLSMPVQVFAHYRGWYEELRRELRLLALNHGRVYPLASELSALTLQVEQERRQAVGLDRLDAAIAAGEQRVDLVYRVPVTAGETMGRLRELLEEADVFCREQRLLTLEPTAQQLALRTWYLGEFTRQAAGEQPVPWSGSLSVEADPR
ncbi:ATP-binding protein [Nocardioides panacis]|uniref:ATP-binding protein n=1 Tax=Nocardioides panacis TaxID=2849501 RepID=A0A975Y028_9ACTN|nr:ATP-binding protein [Nocardioides panacis]QWZ08046.1 ATP-binding protein [Nocardioides panacis]